MKSLKHIIIERLTLSNKKVDNKKDLSNVDIDWRIRSIFNANSISDKRKQMSAMKSFYEKNKNVKKLYTEATKPHIIAARLVSAILLQWDDAIDELRSAIINKYNYVKNIEDHLDAYMINVYNNDLYFYFKNYDDYSPKEIKESLINYFEIYNIYEKD